tara:strand:- start:52 stop:1983 length:1932 start_codon:yes stop_codon:yes gene_type:complete
MNSIFKLIFILNIIFAGFLHGQTIQELEKLKNEYEGVLERQSLQKPSEVTEAEKTVKSTVLPDKLVYSRKDVESLLINTQKLIDEMNSLNDTLNRMPNIGYDIFTKRDSIPFWQNIPIPQNYVLGPGDEIIISIWGETNSYISHKINREGEIYVENVGILNLSDKNLNEAKKYTVSKFSKVYSTLSGSNPKSFIDLSIGELKSINVHFVGFVNIPGVHMLHPFSNLISGITQAGGIDMKGSLRSIKVFRNNKKIITLDLYDYLFQAQSLNEIRLMDQDIVLVSPRISKIPLNGEVLMPGYYETKENESLKDLLFYAGGKLSSAADIIFIYNKSLSGSSQIIKNNKAYSKTIISGDSIFVSKNPDDKTFIRINGQVKNPGVYPYEKNMLLSELLEVSMVYKDEQYLKTVDLSKIIVNRVNPEGNDPILHTINLIKSDFVLQSGDHVNIPKNKFYDKVEVVKVTGEVKNPGIYSVNNLKSLNSIINAAGGFTINALDSGVEVFRDSLMVSWSNDNVPLFDGDSINVLKKSGAVLVKGEVNKAGYLTYKKGDSVKKYINRAGGYNAFADPKDIYVIYPNGTAIPYRAIRKIKVIEGSTIIINPRNISGSSRGISGWQIVGEISTRAGSIATTVLSLILISNQINAN